MLLPNPQPYPGRTWAARRLLLVQEMWGHVYSCGLAHGPISCVSWCSWEADDRSASSWEQLIGTEGGPGEAPPSRRRKSVLLIAQTQRLCTAAPKAPGPGTSPLVLPELLLPKPTVWDSHPSWLVFRGFFGTRLPHGLKTTRTEISEKTG